MLSAFEPHRWTSDEFIRLVDAGALPEDAHLELLNGEICKRSPQSARHSAVTVRVRRVLERLFGDDHRALDHSPVRAGPESLPEPDIANAAAGFQEYWTLDLVARRLVVHRAPTGRDWMEIAVRHDTDAVEVAGVSLPVAALLPPR